MLSREVVRKRLKAPKQVSIIMMMRCPSNRFRQLFSGIIFDRKHAVDIGANRKGLHHVVRRSNEIITAESLEIVRLLLSYDSSQAGIRLKPGTIELANNAGATAFFFVTIYLMPVKAEYPKSNYSATEMHPIAEYFNEEVVKHIIGREVPDIIAVHCRLFSPAFRFIPRTVLSRF